MEPIKLWPQGAPYAQGNSPADCPFILPFLVQSEKPTAAMIVCPGGGYGGLAADYEGEEIAKWMNSIGMSAFVLNYRVAPYRHPCPLLDAQRAIRYIRSRAEEWGINPGQIGIMGFSAGGHLASTLGTHYDLGKVSEDPIDALSCRPDAMVLCYAVVTFGPFRERGSMVNLIGKDADEELQQSLSNETQVTADTPPAFIWQTADDQTVHCANSLLFAEALSRSGVPFDLHIYQTGPHGMALALDSQDVGMWTKQCQLWLTRLWNL